AFFDLEVPTVNTRPCCVRSGYCRRGDKPQCPLLAQSGHHDRAEPCPLLGVKRTSIELSAMSASDPKQKWTLGSCRSGSAQLSPWPIAIWIKVKNPNASAVMREAGEDWRRRRTVVSRSASCHVGSRRCTQGGDPWPPPPELMASKARPFF